MNTEPQQTPPLRGVMYGLTHDRAGNALVRDVRVLKVGLGVPKGRASYIYTHRSRWIIRYGVWKEKKLVMETAKGSDDKLGFPSKQEAEEWYRKNKETFAISDRPQKIPFFTFTRRSIIEAKGKIEEVFEPDFAAIEAHGDTPREIDIVFMGDNPLFGEYQAWSASELKCHGDGLNALRVISMGNEKWPGWKGAGEAKAKYFIVSNQCFDTGLCPYAQEGGKDRLVCKPSATLSFQLANSIRLGATAYFTTTSIRSTQQLFSSLGIIQAMAERAGASIANTPMKLVLAPFRTNHNGIPATQYGVSLELRTQDVQKLRELLAEAAWKPAPRRMLSEVTEEILGEIPQISAAEMTAEFVPDAPLDVSAMEEFEEAEPVGESGANVGSSGAAAATEKKTEVLADKLTKERERKAKAPVAAPAAASAAAPAEKTKPEPPAAPPASTEPLPPPPSAQLEKEKIDKIWQARLYQTFAGILGAERFFAGLEACGMDSIEMVTKENHVPAWNAMMAQQRKMEGLEVPVAEVQKPAPGGDTLF